MYIGGTFLSVDDGVCLSLAPVVVGVEACRGRGRLDSGEES